MGLYRQRRRSTWWCNYTLGGRRFYESLHTEDIRVAKERYKQIRAKIDLGIIEKTTQKKRILLDEAMELYLANYARIKKASADDDTLMLSRFNEAMATIIGKPTLLGDVSRFHIESFLAQLKRDGKSPARINRHLTAIKTMLNKNLEWDNLSKNNAKGIRMFKEVGRTRYLEIQEIRALIKACSPRLKPLVLMAVLTGLRQGDIFRLRWSDMSFESRTMSITQRKTNHSLVLQMSEAVADVLRKIPKSADSPYIFNDNGGCLEKDSWVRSSFKNACKKAGITDFQFRDLRRTFGTLQCRLGQNVKTVSELMGHTSTRMTERYIQISSETKKEAVDVLGAKITGVFRAND